MLDKFTAYELARKMRVVDIARDLEGITGVGVFISKSDWSKLVIKIPGDHSTVKPHKLRLDLIAGYAVLDLKGKPLSSELEGVYRRLEEILRNNGVPVAVGPISELNWDRQKFKPYNVQPYEYQRLFC